MVALLLGEYEVPFSTTVFGNDRFIGVSHTRLGAPVQHDIDREWCLVGLTGALRLFVCNDNERDANA